MVQQIKLAHMPPELALYATCYTDVENATFLREQLLAGNTEYEYAFIDASMIVSRKQVLAAAFRAMNDYLNDRLKSRNIHSEIVFALSPNNNIGEAFRRFGIQESTKTIVVLKVATGPSTTLESVQTHFDSSIKGQESPFEDSILQKASDLPRIRKVYKLNTTNVKQSKLVNGDSHPPGNQHYELESQILGLMALRGTT